eukprot:TRINITY_DN6087_c0_g1_i1.p1 TRINITY_DN6087_c0_g1~~TRINITY_DN6087_c0_g1_i1.p1  ORF type:complete len:2271 (+),score=336.61 TRINITY_DN6087_c0_g1_i1:83-6895(+)
MASPGPASPGHMSLRVAATSGDHPEPEHSDPEVEEIREEVAVRGQSPTKTGLNTQSSSGSSSSKVLPVDGGDSAVGSPNTGASSPKAAWLDEDPKGAPASLLSPTNIQPSGQPRALPALQQRFIQEQESSKRRSSVRMVGIVIGIAVLIGAIVGLVAGLAPQNKSSSSNVAPVVEGETGLRSSHSLTMSLPQEVFQNSTLREEVTKALTKAWVAGMDAQLADPPSGIPRKGSKPPSVLVDGAVLERLAPGSPGGRRLSTVQASLSVGFSIRVEEELRNQTKERLTSMKEDKSRFMSAFTTEVQNTASQNAALSSALSTVQASVQVGELAEVKEVFLSDITNTRTSTTATVTVVTTTASTSTMTASSTTIVTMTETTKTASTKTTTTETTVTTVTTSETTTATTKTNTMTSITTTSTTTPGRCDSRNLAYDAAKVNLSGCDGIIEGTSCTASCMPGFEPVIAGDYPMSCAGPDRLEGGLPSCIRAACTVPAMLNSSTIVSSCGSSVSNDQTCTARCRNGYSGTPVTYTCQSPNLVPGSAPTCTGNPCTRNVPFGLGITSNCNGKKTGETCQVQCVAGYEPANSAASKTSTCQADGRFTDSSFTCRQLACGDPSSHLAATVATTCAGSLFGQTCAAYCAAGYDVVGNPSTFLCNPLASSSWAGFVNPGASGGLPQPPTCVAKPCNYGLPSARGLTHDCAGVTTGSSCTLSAEQGFSLTAPGGANTATYACQANSVFTGPVVSISEAKCTNFPSGTGVAHSCNTTGVPYTATCWSYCQTGYTGSPKQYSCGLVGNTVQLAPVSGAISCSPDGGRLLSESSGRQLQGASCSQAAADTGSLTTGGRSTDCAGKPDGEMCIAECRRGYDLSGEPQVLRCTAGSLNSFYGSLPSCQAKVCQYSKPDGPGVQHNCNGKKTGATCQATCGNGYTYAVGQQAQQFTCTETGEFIGDNPTCQPAPCTDLTLGSASMNASDCRNKTTGEFCVVDCSYGWELEGPVAIYTCQASGAYNGTQPSCRAKACNFTTPGDDINGTACGALTTGQSCDAGCAAGFAGSSTRLTCQPSGVVEGLIPMCAPQPCGQRNFSVAGAEDDCGQDMLFGMSCAAFCELGYDLVGNISELQCALNGSTATSPKLLGPEPYCRLGTCSNNMPADIFQHDCQGVLTGRQCTVDCPPGYLGFPTTMNCSKTGILMGSFPRCRPTTTTTTWTTTSVTSVTSTSTTVTSNTLTSTTTLTSTSKSSTVTSYSKTSTTTSSSTVTSTKTSSSTTSATMTSTVMVTITGELYLIVTTDAPTFVTSLNSVPGAMDALKAGIAGPFRGLMPSMVTIQNVFVTPTRRLAEWRILQGGSVTVEYQLQYPGGLLLTWQMIEQSQAALTTAINSAFQERSTGMSIIGVTLLEPDPTTTRTFTSRTSTTSFTNTGTSSSVTHTTTGTHTSTKTSVTSTDTSTKTSATSTRTASTVTTTETQTHTSVTVSTLTDTGTSTGTQTSGTVTTTGTTQTTTATKTVTTTGTTQTITATTTATTGTATYSTTRTNTGGGLLAATPPGSSIVKIIAVSELSVRHAEAFIGDPNAAEGVRTAIASVIGLLSRDVTVGFSIVPGTADNKPGNAPEMTRVKVDIRIQKLVQGNLDSAQVTAALMMHSLGHVDKARLASGIQDETRKAAQSNQQPPTQYSVQVNFLSPKRAVVDRPQSVMRVNVAAELSVPNPEAFVADANAREGIRTAIANACNLSKGTVTIGLVWIGRVEVNISIQKLVDGDKGMAKTVAAELVQTLGRLDKATLASAIAHEIRKQAEAENQMPVAYAVQVLFLSPTKALDSASPPSPSPSPSPSPPSPSTSTSPAPRTEIRLNATAKLIVPSPEMFIADANAREGIRTALANACGLSNEMLTIGLSVTAASAGTHVKVDIFVRTFVDGSKTSAKLAAEMLIQTLGHLDKPTLASAIADEIRHQAQSKNQVPVTYAVQVLFLSPSKAFDSAAPPPPPPSARTEIRLNITAKVSMLSPAAFVVDAKAREGVRIAFINAGLNMATDTLNIGLSVFAQAGSEGVNMDIFIRRYVDGGMTQATGAAEELAQAVARVNKPALASAIEDEIRKLYESQNQTPVHYSLQFSFVSLTRATLGEVIRSTIRLRAGAELSIANPDAFLGDQDAREGVRRAIATECGLQGENLTVAFSMLAARPENITGSSNLTSVRRVQASIFVEKLTDGSTSEAWSTATQILGMVGAMGTTELAAAIGAEMQQRNTSYSVQVPFLSTASVFTSTSNRTNTARILTASW